MALSISATSPTFTITTAPTVTIDSPNSGSYAYTSSIVVQFTKNNFTTGVDLYYTSGTTFNTNNNIAINFSGTQFTWSIPDSLSGTNIYIWVRKYIDSSVIDRTNSAISITPVTQNVSVPLDETGFAESIIDGKTVYKTVVNVPLDETGFSADTTTESKRIYKHVKTAEPDVTQFSTDEVIDSKRTWRYDKPATDETEFSTDEAIDSKRTWKHIKPATDETEFSTDQVIDSKRTWKHVKPATDETEFSADVVTDDKRTWKWIQTATEVIAFTESVNNFKTIGLPSINEVTQFVEDITTVIHQQCKVRKFQASPAESYSTSYKTGWIKASKDLDKNTLIRRLGVEYHSTDPITLKIYADGDLVNPVFTNTLAAATAKETTNKSLRVGKRARMFMIEMATDSSTNSNTKIEDIEVLTDG
jgi:hypothetical protein